MVLVAGLALGQLPATDLYAISYSLNGEKGTVRSVKYLSAFNQGGYNNQPFYDGSRYLYITTDYYADATEVARMDLDDQVLERLTQSPESEYSPQPHPGGRSYTTVRVEADSSQTLTAYSLKSGRHKNFAPELDGVAYYRWINDNTVATATLPLPMTLSIYNRLEDSLTIIEPAVGRCLQVVEGDLLYYTSAAEQEGTIKTLDVKTGIRTDVCPLLEGAQDFVVLPGRRIFMARGSLIYIYSQGAWVPALDLSKYGISDITRLAARRGQLFIVDKRKKKE